MGFWNLVKYLVMFILGLGVVLGLIYFWFVRPWILRIGCTEDELKMHMPGDGFVISPGTKYTHAITVNAPADLVWAYLIQVGYKRAGWYNWDFINRMAAKDYFYENNKSAERIIPELQNLKEGDKLSIVPQISFDVSELKSNGHMLLTGNENGKYVVVWSYVLKKIDDTTTRLYVRWTSDLGKGFVPALMNLLVTEPGGVGIQQTRMLKGIKRRAERDYLNA